MKRFPLIVVSLLSICFAAQQQKDQGTFKFETKINVVVVPVLVTDSHGHAIGTLKKEDFQVFDKDKLQTITGFTIQERASSAPVNSLTAPAASSAPTTAPAPPPSAPVVPERSIIFLFDDLHLQTGDLALVQKAAAKMLAGSLTDTDYAAVLSTSGQVSSPLTRDRSKLTDAIARLHEVRVYRPGRQCPDVSPYQADLILNRNDGAALEIAAQEAIQCANLDPRMRSVAETMARTSANQALALNDQGTRVVMRIAKIIVGKLAPIPGQHLLILVSPGFLGNTPEAVSDKSQLIDLAAQNNVTISALDARGLYVSEFDASEPAAGGPQVMQAKSNYKRQSMSSDEDVMAELADGTGGSYFHNSNDLAGGFEKLTLAPEYLYLLEFSPHDTKQDGSYHKLKITVDQAGLKLRGRHGYFAPKPEKKKS